MKKIANLGVCLIPFLNNFIILDFYIYPRLYEKSSYGMVYYFLLGSVLSFIFGFLVSNFSFNPIRFLRRKKVIKFTIKQSIFPINNYRKDFFIINARRPPPSGGG